MPGTPDHAKGCRAESLASWFLRLNGFFLIPNFYLHDEERSSNQKGEVDLAAIRHPWRRELGESAEPLMDHPAFENRDVPLLLIVEVKSGMPCTLNGPWTKPSVRVENVRRALFAFGTVKPSDRERAVRKLADSRSFTSPETEARFCAIGDSRSDAEGMKDVLQFTWDEAVRWIYDRFKAHYDLKRQHNGWDLVGRSLFETVDGKDANKYAEHWKAWIASGNSTGQ